LNTDFGFAERLAELFCSLIDVKIIVLQPLKTTNIRPQIMEKNLVDYAFGMFLERDECNNPRPFRSFTVRIIAFPPGRTVRADIRLDIRKITDVRVESSVQPRISVVNRAPIFVAPISAWISAWISVLRISESEVYY